MIWTGLFCGNFTLMIFVAMLLVDPQPSTDPKEVVSDVIKVHGGKDKLIELQGLHLVFQGVSRFQKSKAKVTGEYWFQCPDKCKMVINYEFDTGEKSVVTRVSANGSTWVKTDSNPSVELKGNELREEQESLFVTYASRLFPLVSDSSLSLSDVRVVKIDDKQMIKMKVSRKDKMVVILYFDDKSKLLMRTESSTRLFGETTQSIEQFDDYQAIDGIPFPLKKRLVIGDMFSVDSKCSRVKRTAKLPDSLFARP